MNNIRIRGRASNAVSRGGRPCCDAVVIWSCRVWGRKTVVRRVASCFSINVQNTAN